MEASTLGSEFELTAKGFLAAFLNTPLSQGLHYAQAARVLHTTISSTVTPQLS